MFSMCNQRRQGRYTEQMNRHVNEHVGRKDSQFRAATDTTAVFHFWAQLNAKVYFTNLWNRAENREQKGIGKKINAKKH